MTAPTPQQHADGITVSQKAKQVAEELGFGHGGKAGGVIIVVVDHDGEQSIVGHAGDDSPMYAALRFAIRELATKAAEMCGGERILSSVQKWRAATKGRKS